MSCFSLQMRSDGRILKTEQGLLLRSLQPSDSGMYQCTATEKNFKHSLVKLQLVVLSSRAVNNVLVEGAGGLVSSSLHSSNAQWTPSTGQYKDLLTILSQPEMTLINQYCQDYWQFGDPVLGALKAKDLKELKEQKKPRNRRHHGEWEENEEQEEVETWGAQLCVWNTLNQPPNPVKTGRDSLRVAAWKKIHQSWKKETEKKAYKQNPSHILSNSKIYDTQYLL